MRAMVHNWKPLKPFYQELVDKWNRIMRGPDAVKTRAADQASILGVAKCALMNAQTILAKHGSDSGVAICKDALKKIEGGG
jgi:hypothetical protein